MAGHLYNNVFFFNPSVSSAMYAEQQSQLNCLPFCEYFIRKKLLKTIKLRTFTIPSSYTSSGTNQSSKSLGIRREDTEYIQCIPLCFITDYCWTLYQLLSPVAHVSIKFIFYTNLIRRLFS